MDLSRTYAILLRFKNECNCILGLIEGITWKLVLTLQTIFITNLSFDAPYS